MTSLQKREQRSMPLRELTASTASPVATVAANLMPPEVLAKRRLSWLKRRMTFALIALVALLGLGFALVHQSTSASKDDLANAQSQTLALQRRVNTFDDVTRIQGETAQIRSLLSTAMTGDVQWSTLIRRLTAAAPSGVTITDVAAELAADDSGGGQPSTLESGTEPQLGKVDITGTAKDYRSVAMYVDALAKVKGVGSVEPGSLGNEGGKSTYTVSVGLTKAALGGPFARGVK